MVAKLGDKLIISDVEKFINDKHLVQWSEAAGVKKSVDFIFMPFYHSENAEDNGYIAIEASKISQFQSLCLEVKEVEGGLGKASVIKYEFTVTKQFKYGQGEEETRFLVLQDPCYKVYQHRYTQAAFSTKARDALLKPRALFDLRAASAVCNGRMSLKALLGEELKSF